MNWIWNDASIMTSVTFLKISNQEIVSITPVVRGDLCKSVFWIISINKMEDTSVFT